MPVRGPLRLLIAFVRPLIYALYNARVAVSLSMFPRQTEVCCTPLRCCTGVPWLRTPVLKGVGVVAYLMTDPGPTSAQVKQMIQFSR